MMSNDEIFYEEDGRVYKREFFEKKIPHYTYVYGKFVGKFFSNKKETDFAREDLYEFKIYEGEIEILKTGQDEVHYHKRRKGAVILDASQLPNKILFFQREDNHKVYYKLNLQDISFQDFTFLPLLQQNDDDEAFGTIEAYVSGFLVEYTTQVYYKKRYKELNLVSQKKKKEDVKPTKVVFEKEEDQKAKKYSPHRTSVKEKGGMSSIFWQFLFAAGLLFLGLWTGFIPFILAGLFWLFYLLYHCLFRRFLFPLLGLLLILLFIKSILSVDWHNSSNSYIPKVTKSNARPELVKVIELVSPDGKGKDILISHEMKWKGYAGEEYAGSYYIKQSELHASRAFKNQLDYNIRYDEVIYNLAQKDMHSLESLYSMFDKIREQEHLDRKSFAEMVVTFVQNIPYCLVLDGSCNVNDYKDPSIREILRVNPGQCLPFQKFGITTPVEFMTNLKGDCDSRTVLLYSILKYYGYQVAIFSSEYYKHSILGIELPYGGVTYKTAGHYYTLWETTDVFYPGKLPAEISNLNYWKLSIN